jgi:flagellar biogenesis protein FliO
MNTILWLAAVLFVIWLAAKLIFAVTGFFLNLLWIAALVLIAFWLFKKFFGGSSSSAGTGQ